MAKPIELLDTVAVVRDVPELRLTAGEVGAVVEVLSPDAYEVEFTDEAGRTSGVHTLRAAQLLRLHLSGTAFRPAPVDA